MKRSASEIEELPEWISSQVRRGARDDDARFPWVLEIRGVPSDCGELRWEQFVMGGFTIHFSDGSSRYYSAVETMRRINPSARRFGPWSDDILPRMAPGPRPVGAYHGATCSGGTTRPPSNPRATMRGPSADPRGASYRFEDAPGFSKNFGDTIDGKVFTGIAWSTSFEHKLWREGGSQPMFRVQFSLTGRYDQSGADTRVVR